MNEFWTGVARSVCGAAMLCFVAWLFGIQLPGQSAPPQQPPPSQQAYPPQAGNPSWAEGLDPNQNWLELPRQESFEPYTSGEVNRPKRLPHSMNAGSNWPSTEKYFDRMEPSSIRQEFDADYYFRRMEEAAAKEK